MKMLIKVVMVSVLALAVMVVVQKILARREEQLLIQGALKEFGIQGRKWY